MNKLTTFFQEWKNSPPLIVTGAIYLSAFLYLFFQNFVFSSSVDILAFRGVDDLAFQMYLRNAHEGINIFGLNGYGYGWLYWFPIVVLTYPAFFLSKYAGIDVPLLIIPRMVSLIFTFATAIVLYKIASHYTKSKFQIAVILLLFLSFPCTGYFAMRFGTVAQTQFFSALAFYLAISRKNYDVKNIVYIALAVTAAASTKLASLFILPVIGLILADRLSWKINKETLKKASLFAGVVVGGFLLLGQPDLQTTLHHAKKVKTNHGQEFTILENLQHGVISSTLHVYVFCLICFLFFLLSILKAARGQKDYLYICVGITLSTLYLITTVQMGPAYVAIYSTVYIYLMLMGTLILEYIPKKLAYIGGIFLLAGNLYLNWNTIQTNTANDPIAWNSYFSMARAEETKNRLTTQDTVRDEILKTWDQQKQIYILRDYRTPEFISAMRKKVTNIATFDNRTHTLRNTKGITFDIIAFSKREASMEPEKTFHERLKSADEKIRNTYIGDRDFTKSFMKDHKLNGISYSLLYEDDDFLVYKKTN